MFDPSAPSAPLTQERIAARCRMSPGGAPMAQPAASRAISGGAVIVLSQSDRTP